MLIDIFSLLLQIITALIAGTCLLVHLPIQAAIELISTCISGLFWSVILYAICSWYRSATPAMYFVDMLVMPVLNPIRRVMPRIGGMDWSALALIVLLQVLEIVLHHFSRAVLL